MAQLNTYILLFKLEYIHFISVHTFHFISFHFSVQQQKRSKATSNGEEALTVDKGGEAAVGVVVAPPLPAPRRRPHARASTPSRPLQPAMDEVDSKLSSGLFQNEQQHMHAESMYQHSTHMHDDDPKLSNLQTSDYFRVRSNTRD